MKDSRTAAVVLIGLGESASRESCEVEESVRGVRVASVISAAENTCSYELRASAEWTFTSLVLRAGGRGIDVQRTEKGWTVDGVLRPDLNEAREVDISVSPLSNTLPIRRLALAVGESADIVTAYVLVPELEVMPDPQRYTRVDKDTYLYESRDSDFRRNIVVDTSGVVVHYPGLFARERPQ